MNIVRITQIIALLLCVRPAACIGATPYSSLEDTVPDVILASLSSADLEFGLFVASNGDVNGDGYDDFAVTADKFNDCCGRAYLYFGGKDRVYEHADHIFDGESPGDFFGQWITLADLNNDKYADVVVGAVGHNNGQGRVYVYFGGPDMDEQADMILDGEPGTYSWFGRVIDAADIDKDGYTDLVVNAIGINEGRARAYLYYGGDPMDTVADKVFDGENPGDAFGREMDMGPDVNGDGYGDIIFGSRSWKAPTGFGSGQGRAYLYYGGPKETMDTTCDRVFTGERVGDQFGSDVCLFDIDGDNYAEVIVGAREYRGQGRMYLYWGEKDMDTQPDLIFNGERRTSLGNQIDCGNINGDKYGDILVASYNYGQNKEGRISLYYGAPKETMDVNCDHTFTGEGGMFGGDLSIGDINGDDYDDFIIAAGFSKPDGTPRGRAYVYYTKPFPVSHEDMQPQLVKEISEDVKPIVSLHKASSEGDIDKLKRLISKGANVNSIASYDGKMTPLHHAAISGHKEVVEVLLNHGARIDALDNMAITPLHRAAEHGHADVAKLLIDKGADINRKDILSASALHYASKKGHRDVVALLIARGADINARDAAGKTPLDVAMSRNRPAIAELLTEKGAAISTIHTAAFAGNLEKVRSFIEDGTDVNAKDKWLWTALHYACWKNHRETVEFLLAKGADLDAREEKDKTPMAVAEEEGHTEIVELLRKHGARE